MRTLRLCRKQHWKRPFSNLSKHTKTNFFLRFGDHFFDVFTCPHASKNVAKGLRKSIKFDQKSDTENLGKIRKKRLKIKESKTAKSMALCMKTRFREIHRKITTSLNTRPCAVKRVFQTSNRAILELILELLFELFWSIFS